MSSNAGILLYLYVKYRDLDHHPFHNAGSLFISTRILSGFSRQRQSRFLFCRYFFQRRQGGYKWTKSVFLFSHRRPVRLQVGYFGVFDGHGGEGDRCSQFARDAVQRRLQDRLKANEAFSSAYPKSFTDANTMLHRSRIDDSLSGTTAITVFIKDGVLHVANAGDSRAIAVTEDNGTLAAKPLSIDQTPYRKDERERCKKSGARIMTFDQLEGTGTVSNFLSTLRNVLYFCCQVLKKFMKIGGSI